MRKFPVCCVNCKASTYIWADDMSDDERDNWTCAACSQRQKQAQAAELEKGAAVQ